MRKKDYSYLTKKERFVLILSSLYFISFVIVYLILSFMKLTHEWYWYEILFGGIFDFVALFLMYRLGQISIRDKKVGDNNENK